ncbi:copper transporter [Pseudactinotalea suaedae]|uniref:copper transporter n=1 Tax=Pseudactinotalea suaedae TaxID=1524924 RepID=UPI0012E0DC1D|nr:copper transporter [Pseudactinotalea suaedae]
MIDFRYHIVSLIAVFLALAVGVVLGAGPLQGSIGDQLTEQIENLRQEKEDLRVELERSQALSGDLAVFVDGTSQQLLAGALADVDVAVIETAGAAGAVTGALLDRIEQAGGTVVGHVALTPRWTDAADAPVRDETAEMVVEQMAAPPPAETANSQVLGMALGQALTQRDPLSSESFTTGALELYTTFRDADLVGEVVAPTGPADVVLVVAPAAVPGAEPDASVQGINVDTVTGLAGTDTVVAGTDTEESDLLDAIRGDAEAAEAVSTVDSADLISGQVTAPLVLAALARGAAVDHYGTGESTSAVIPTLPPLDDPDDGTGTGADTSTEDATEETAESTTEETTESTTEETTP